MMETEYICRVCGFEYDTPTWEEGEASGDICLCCGVLFGYEDGILKAILAFRKEWIIEKHAKFDSPKYMPENWDLCAQIKKIPEEWRGDGRLLEKICPSNG